MGVDELRAAVEEESEARVASLLADARAAARLLLEAAESARSSRRQKVLHEEAIEIRRKASARVAAARSEAQQRVLATRQNLLDRVFDLASDRLSNLLDEPSARQRMVELVEQSLRYMPQGPIVVECSTDLSELLCEVLSGRHGLDVECVADMPSGFRTKSGDGALVVDATLTKLLELARPALAIGVLRQVEHGKAP